jgi:tripartite-type tricarboxylate transporter receptor subunit TctC
MMKIMHTMANQPGKFTFSSAGTGNGSHLAAELLRSTAGGLNMVYIPYKGGAPAIQALLAGDVQITSVSVNTSVANIQSGKARAIGLAATKRSPALPDFSHLLSQASRLKQKTGLLFLGQRVSQRQLSTSSTPRLP